VSSAVSADAGRGRGRWYTGTVRSPRTLLPVAGITALLLLLARPAVLGQAFRSGVDLVVIAATVLDGDGRLVPGLSQSDFHVFDDGVEQRIVQFNAERVPVSLGLAVDVSDSMIGARMAAARKAIDRFVLSLLDEGDEAFLMVFNHAPRVMTPWARPRSLSGRMDRVTPSGGTAIFDAVVKAAAMFDTRRFQRCGLVVISDGNDTGSDASLQDTLRRINQTDAFLYAIALDAPGGAAINKPFSPEALNELAGQSGGYTEVIHDPSELTAAAERISNELNHQYTIAYAPPRAPDGQYHGIRVKTNDSALTVRSRRGYTHLKPKPGGPAK
jgi:Ca-activated chloride channel homolog